jgi:serine/threonine protein kinase
MKNTSSQLKKKRERSERRQRVAKERQEAHKKMHEEPVLSEQLTAKNVNSNYSFGKVLGRGATAVVYVANSKSTGKKYACKAVCKEQLIKMFGRDILSRARRSIETEINLGMSLKHENIVRLHEVYESRTHIYYILEYCNGGELFKFIQSCEHIRESHIVRIVYQITSALEYMHSKDILHRDLKPANVLVVKPEFRAKATKSAAGVTVKLTDFGLSKQLEEQSGAKATTNSFVGTPSHMAPEMYVPLSFSLSHSHSLVFIYTHTCTYT